MDSRDSSSSTAAAASRDRDAASNEDDAILSVTAGLAKEAALLFQSRRFSECVDVLNQLMQKKPNDPKVLHNITVAEYFRDGCSDPRNLLEVLNMVKSKSQELARASVEQGEVVGNIANSVAPVPKGSNTMPHQFSNANNSTNAYSDEFDTSVATLNIAVVLFHLHDYANALSVLEPLYQNIEPIDETTALHICLLLLDVALASRDAARAAEVIQYLEKASGVASMVGVQGGNGSTAHQSSNPQVKSSTPSNSTSLDVASSDNASSGSSENPLARTLSDDALDYETLLSTLDIGGQNLSRPASVLSTNDISRTSADRPAPAVDLKLKLHLYKVRLLLLTRNLKATKREVKLAMNIARGKDSSTALLLKSQLEYARGNHPKAIKLLNTSINRTESGASSIFNNNLGCIFHQLRKHHMATKLFSRALSSSCRKSEKPLKLLTFSQDKSLLIIYNCGLQYLICGKPILAAQCFKKASSVFYNEPLLWVRLAECCLLALEKGLLEPINAPSNDEVRVHVVGKGKWRQLVIDGDSNTPNIMLEDEGFLSSKDFRKLTLPFARRCLLNALHLLNSLKSKSSKAGFPCALEQDESNPAVSFKNSNHKNLPVGDVKGSNLSAIASQVGSNGDSKDPKGVASPNTTLQNSVFAFEDICRREKHMIKQAVLANLAYVELFLGNPLRALSSAKSLLSLPECSRIYIFLGHVYAAEALCLLNQPKEAAEHLSVYMSDKNEAELPYSDEDSIKWKVEKAGDSDEGGPVVAGNTSAEDAHDVVFLKPEEARGVLYVNLVAISAMQGNLEQAHWFATKAVSVIPTNPKAILAAVYVDLLVGKSKDALNKLKQCSHVRYLPGSVTLNSYS